MPLSWNEIKDRALSFSREWKGEDSERAEAQSFWNGFFNVFGIDRRRVGVFDLGPQLALLFQVLNQAEPRRPSSLEAANRSAPGRHSAARDA